MSEVYVSTDIESNGPVPGPHSMLSLGSAAYSEDGVLIATFSANLEELAGATGHPVTMNWWQGFPEAWAKGRENLESPAAAMQRYVEWLKTLPGKPVFVGYPASFDFMFVCWYLCNFVGKYPFGFAALDLRSYAMAMLGTTFHQTTKDALPREWFGESPHTHVALEDAIEQGELLCNILRERKRRLTLTEGSR